MTDLHVDPPMTMARASARWRWILPTAAVVFGALAVGAMASWLFWDEPITRWVIDARAPGLNAVFRRVSFLGSTPVVLTVSAVAAILASRRCPRLAIAIVIIALARPLAEFALKELVSRDRPIGDRMVRGEGYSFPSGHPLATAASWGVLPLVVALYTRRRLVWWVVDRQRVDDGGARGRESRVAGCPLGVRCGRRARAGHLGRRRGRAAHRRDARRLLVTTAGSNATTSTNR